MWPSCLLPFRCLCDIIEYTIERSGGKYRSLCWFLRGSAYLLSRAFTFSLASSRSLQVLRISRILRVWFSSAFSTSSSPTLLISSSMYLSFLALATVLAGVSPDCNLIILYVWQKVNQNREILWKYFQFSPASLFIARAIRHTSASALSLRVGSNSLPSA